MSENLHRLEGSDSQEQGGLIVRKKPSEHEFKKPQVSLLGLDKLAALKRKKEKEKEKEKEEEEEDDRGSSSRKSDSRDRRYRHHEEETPTHTGGVDKEAHKRFESRVKKQRLVDCEMYFFHYILQTRSTLDTT